MAVAFVKAHTGFTSKTSANSFTVTLTSAVPSGNVLLVTLGYDNTSATAPTLNTRPAGFSTLVDVDSPQSAAGGGTKQSLVQSDGRAYSSGTVLTFLLTAPVTARAAVITEWSGADPTLTVVGTPHVAANNIIPTVPSGFATGDLIVASFVSEMNTAISAAITGGTWSIAAATNTTGGGSAANVSVSTQYKASSVSTAQASTVVDGSGVVVILEQAASGPVTYSVTGTTAATSTLSGAPMAYFGLTATTAVASTTSGSITSRLPATGTIVATSTTSGSVVIAANKYPVTGTVAATSSTSGSITSRLPAAGTTAATSTTSGTLAYVRHALTGTAAATSTTSGSITSRLPATGTVASTSTVTGTPYCKVMLTGTVASTSTTSGNVTIVGGAVTYPVTGTTAVTTAVSGSLTSRLMTTGTVAATSTTTGNVTRRLAMAGTTAATSTTTGTVTSRLLMAGTTAGLSAVSGSVTKVAGSQPTSGFWGITL